MKFILDECVSPRVRDLLEVFDRRHEIRPLTNYVAPGTSDEAWIRRFADWDPRPIILSGDGRILRNRAERKALDEAGLIWFFFAAGWTNLDWNTFAWKIIKVWPTVVAEAERTRPPAIYEISANLKVSLAPRR